MGTFPGDEAKSIPAGTSGNFRFTGGLLGSNSQAENIAKNINGWNNPLIFNATNKQDIINKIGYKKAPTKIQRRI